MMRRRMLSLLPLLALVAALVVAPSSASAMTGSLAFQGLSGQNVIVSETATVTPSDCASEGCSWFASATIEPQITGCPAVSDSSNGVWTGQIEDQATSDTETFPVALNHIAGDFDICLYVSDPNNAEDVDHLVATLPYSAPPPTAVVTGLRVANGMISGALEVTQTRCVEDCLWQPSASLVSSGPCSGLVGRPAWSGTESLGLGVGTSRFSVPAPAVGSVVVCFYETSSDPAETLLIAARKVTVRTDRSPTNLRPEVTSGHQAMRVQLTCPITKVSCSARVALHGDGHDLGAANVRIARGQSRTVVVGLNSVGRRLLRQDFGILTKVTIVARDSFGDRRVMSLTGTIWG